MATFDEFYASLDPDVGVRGKQFEKFVKWFLKTDPTWATQVDEVWLWNEYPKRWGADCGIDLIFNHKNGKTWAVQSKCVSPNNDIKKSEIDSFLSESNDSKIDGRLLIASTDGIGKNAQQVIHRQEKQVVCFLLDQFRQSEIEFPSSMAELNQGRRKEKKTPRPHQIEAIEKVSQGLKTADRGQILMACGTGKTMTGLWIKEKLKAKQVLVLVPSLSLLSQTLKEWNAEANQPFKWICVCSDKSVAKENSEDEWISNTSEIGVPVTNEPLEIKHFLDESDSKVVFATYQSSQLIVEAQEHHDTSEFDLVIADEAHRCAGRVSNAFGSILDENKIKSSKRLFFTATPRILSKEIKTKSVDMDFEVTSMDDHSIFGSVLYQLKFSEAIANDLLSDYQVVVIGVDDEIIKQKIINRELIKVDDETTLDAEMIASQIAITKAIKEYDLNRIITFHSRIKNAKEFANTFDQVINLINDSDLPSGKINCEHISGQMKTSERNQKLYDLKNIEIDERRILTNARCLSEGVDVPTLGGIAFINPKQSQIDIIQAVGRAIRKSDAKKKGTIVIPLYISKKEFFDEALFASNFKKVWQIVIALKSQDNSLMECIDKLRIQKGREGRISTDNNQLDKFIFDIPQTITKNFTNSIETLLVEHSSEDWLEKFGEAQKFREQNGHANIPTQHKSLGNWVNWCRSLYREKKLSQERLDLLKSINFIWSSNDFIWEQNFLKIKDFINKNGSEVQPADKELNKWCSHQRSNFNNNLLSKERINLLTEIGFLWDVNEYLWSQRFTELKSYININGDSFVPYSEDLGKWVSYIRKRYKEQKISPNKINQLNQIGFAWDQKEDEWNNQLEKYKNILKNNKEIKKNENQQLYDWINSQRINYRKNLISSERIVKLEEIGFRWNPTDEKWMNIFNEIKSYLSKNKIDELDKSSNLYQTITRIKKQYNSNKLSPEKINLLNSIDFSWEIVDEKELQWNEKYKELQAYEEVNGNTNLPKSHPSLGRWVGTQRQNYKKRIMSEERILLLKNLKSWVWNLDRSNYNKPVSKKLEGQWHQKYLELKEFWMQNGNANPPKSHQSLGRWVGTQRNQYIKNKMNNNRVELLEKIGFIWKVKK